MVGFTSFIGDKLSNFAANLGTSRDKRSGAFYTVDTIPDDQLLNAYETSWVAKKIVDIPAFDSCRSWREWQATAEQIELIEAEEMRLGVRHKIESALVKARLFGGGAILIGDSASDLEKPLDVDRIGKGGLKFLTVLTKRQLAAGQLETDAASEFYGKPRNYTLTNQKGVSGVIHPSRLVVLTGDEIPDPDLARGSNYGWGNSSLLAPWEAITNLDSTTANIASLVYEAKIDVIKIPNLMDSFKANPEYTNELLKRMRLAASIKGNNGMLVMDSEEEYTQKQMSFATLPEVLDRFSQFASGAADIPATRLLSQSPAGMNATGESDTRNYYDRISSMQSLKIQPAMYRLDECIIRSALGTRPKEVHFIWSSLWQISDKERGEIGHIAANTIKTLNDTALIPEDALSKAAVNMLVERSIMPGLDALIEDEFDAVSAANDLEANEVDDD